MVMRGPLVRALEWRARRFSDPAHRLQFLRRTVGHRTDSKRARATRPLHVTVSLVAAALAALTYFWISPKHLAIANAKTVTNFIPPIPPVSTAAPHPEPAGKVWLVQSTPQSELYSNGLRIEDQYATSTAPRRYLAFANNAASSATTAEWRTEPAGIVYHTTESHLAPFEEDQNQSLRRAGEGLLEYVSRRHSYHFVIDRFGRVFRIVRESDYANHAGYSVWADHNWIYLNLNQSFLGVAFEAASKSSGAEASLNAAQTYAGRILTEMLRARYGIAASNCVAHAQVSVNPSNYAVGYHRDWAANLPFAELGLADNYRLAIPSVKLFGFEPDAGLMGNSGPSIAEGLQTAIAQVAQQAAAANLPLERYRAELQQRYRAATRTLRADGAYKENN